MDGLIYAYQLPKSVAQQKYMQERRAAIAEQRKRQLLSATAAQAGGVETGLERTLSGTSLSAPEIAVNAHYAHRRTNSGHGEMEYPKTSSSANSSQSEVAHHSLLSNPFELRHGRRYLRELPYPLPVDLHEVHRQNLRTLLCCRVFGRAVCSPAIDRNVPQRVLEIGCGSGYWSAMCHEYFSSLGHKDVSFTGLDVAPLAPDLRKQGVNWTFVQYDVRRPPFPFDDDTFDLVMLKDMSLVMPLGMASQKFIDESIRILRPGGTLEIWESDHVLRSLTSPPPTVSAKLHHEQRAAAQSATFLVPSGTAFAPAQNKYLHQANVWIQEALDRRKLPPTPCARIAPILYQEADTLDNFGARRVAVPLGELRWERDGSASHVRNASTAHDSVLMPSASTKGKARVAGTEAAQTMTSRLTPDQAALRHVALLTVVQMIENLEPLLKEASGKNAEEWSYWWAGLMGDVMGTAKTGLTSECLEVGAWWASKMGEA